MIDQNWVKVADGSHTDRFQYGYDRAGDRLFKANLVNAALSELYRASSTAPGDSNTAYDPLNRLVAFSRGTLSASGNNGTQLDRIAASTHGQSWALDALGNFAGVTTDGTTTTRSANAQNQTTSVSGATAPTYDAAGNTITDSGHTFAYDAWNRLVAVKDAAGVVLQASYGVDALGRRLSESYPLAAQVNHLYYSPEWQVIEERQGGTLAANLKYQYVWARGYVNELVLRDSYSAGALVPAARLYAQQDANYNVTAVVETTGTVQERHVYDPYGTVTVLSASWAPMAGTLGWRILFQGGRQDPVTGAYLFGMRVYLAPSGVWMQRDPMGLAAGIRNIYNFEDNNSVNNTDSSGKKIDGISMPNDKTLVIYISIDLTGTGFNNPNDAQKLENNISNALKTHGAIHPKKELRSLLNRKFNISKMLSQYQIHSTI